MRCKRRLNNAEPTNHGWVSEKSWQMNKTLDKWADEGLT